MIIAILLLLVFVVFVILFGGAALSGVAIGLGALVLLIILIASVGGAGKNEVRYENQYEKAMRVRKEMKAAKARFDKGYYSKKEYEAKRRQILRL